MMTEQQAGEQIAIAVWMRQQNDKTRARRLQKAGKAREVVLGGDNGPSSLLGQPASILEGQLRDELAVIEARMFRDQVESGSESSRDLRRAEQIDAVLGRV